MESKQGQQSRSSVVKALSGVSGYVPTGVPDETYKVARKIAATNRSSPFRVWSRTPSPTKLPSKSNCSSERNAKLKFSTKHYAIFEPPPPAHNVDRFHASSQSRLSSKGLGASSSVAVCL